MMCPQVIFYISHTGPCLLKYYKITVPPVIYHKNTQCTNAKKKRFEIGANVDKIRTPT